MDRVTEDSHAFKGNLCFVFWIECTFRLIVYPCIGILNWQIFCQAICMIPFMVLALVFGMKCCGHLNETVIKEAGHYRADIVRYCTCLSKTFVKIFYAQSLFIIQEVSVVTDSVTPTSFFVHVQPKSVINFVK